VSAEKTTDAVKLNLRLSKRLHRQLVQQARRNNVSLNSEIVNQLEGHEAATFERISKLAQPMIDSALSAAIHDLFRSTGGGPKEEPKEPGIVSDALDHLRDIAEAYLRDIADRSTDGGPNEEPKQSDKVSSLLPRLRSGRNQAADLSGENSPPVRKADKS
jgi:HicB-like protein involved in pilus formation